MLLLNVTDIGIKCKEIEQSDIADIDQYLSAELFLKKNSASFIKIYSLNQSVVDLFADGKRSSILEGRSYVFNVLYNKICDNIISNFLCGRKNAYHDYNVLDVNKNELFFNVKIDIFGEKQDYYALVLIENITSRKNFEKISTEFIEKYYLLLQSINEPIIIVDSFSGIILEANNHALDFFKFVHGGIVGTHHGDFYDGKERDNYIEFFNKKINEEPCDDILNFFIKNKDNEKIPVQIQIDTALIGTRKVAQVMFYNMSNRFKMEEGRRLLATAVEQAAESVIITDIFGNIQYVNPAFEEVSGYSYPEVLGKNPRLLQSGETPPYQYKLMWAEIAKGHVWRGTFTNKKKNGALYKEEATITPVRDNNGHIINYVAVKRDITQHLILENQIRQSQKMQAIGTLAGGVAHDFNNILTAILGYAELSQGQCPSDSLLYKNLGEIVKASERAGQLVDQILQFSRQGEKNVSSLQLGLIVKEVLKLLRASLPANIELISDIAPNAYVKADPTQMHQVIMNLCTNAYQALEGKGGAIHVRLYTRTLSPKEGVEIGNLQHGSYVCLQVEDTGVGIPPEYLQRIFEPYFTTKKLHEGTGLGLSVVHGIVNDHRGAVTVESIPGKGSCFTVFLPEAAQEEDNRAEQNETASPPREGHILVVDDEQPIAFYLEQVLSHLGYTVTSCRSSEEAYRLFLSRKGLFDLVLTDMGMPGMTGLELATALKKIREDIPVILCTGYSEQVTADNYEQMGLAGFVAKPFSAESVSREVTRILARTPIENRPSPPVR